MSQFNDTLSVLPFKGKSRSKEGEPARSGNKQAKTAAKASASSHVPIPDLDVFSPIKSKEAQPVQPEKRKDKTHKMNKSVDHRTIAHNEAERPEHDIKHRASKTLSLVGNTAISVSVKPPNNKTDSKSSKSSANALQPSTKDNLPPERTDPKPTKSILKDTKYEITRLKARSPSPRRRISLQDRVDVNSSDSLGHLPELENDSPFPTIRKSPEKPAVREVVNGGIQNKGSESPRKKRKDLWMETLEDPQVKVEVAGNPADVVTALAFRTTGSAYMSEGIANRTSASSSGIQSLDVLELQSILRREVEKLRLDMVRQFVTFRSEIGQRWETEISHLRLENERLKAEIHELKEERRKYHSTIPGWR